jgi:hypothetical protein
MFTNLAIIHRLEFHRDHQFSELDLNPTYILIFHICVGEMFIFPWFNLPLFLTPASGQALPLELTWLARAAMDARADHAQLLLKEVVGVMGDQPNWIRSDLGNHHKSIGKPWEKHWKMGMSWGLTLLYLVGGLEPWEFYDFPFSWEWKIIPSDFHSIIFQRGRA